VDAANAVKGLCGDRDYVVVNGNNGSETAVSWITINKDTPSVDVHKITASPNDPALVTGSAHALYLKTTYVSYAAHAAHYTSLSV